MTTFEGSSPRPRPRPRKRASAIGCTSYLTEPLSYQWTITNAKSLMDIRESIDSPKFEVLLPVEDGEKMISTWYLHLISICQNNFDFLVKLCCCGLDCGELLEFSTFWVKDGVFNVVDSKSGEVKCTSEIRVTECETSGDIQIGPVKLFDASELEEHLADDGSLTLEVTASLEYYMDTIGTSSKSTPIPPCNVLEGMKKVYEEMPLTDFTIKCGEKKFKAHKVILASQSPVFYRMFETDMKESRDNVIEIPDIDPAVIADLIAFMYTSKPPNLNKLAKELLCAANKYEMPRLVAICENELMLNLHVDNLLETVQYADSFGATNLKKTCVRMIKCNSSQLFHSKEWKNFKESSHKDLAFEILEFNNLS